MRLSKKIWDELGALSAHVELLDHENGLAKYRDGTTDPQKASIEAVIASHDPDTPSASEVAEQAARQALVAAKAEAKADTVAQYLRERTVAECMQYVEDNVTDLASAKAFLKKVAAVMCVLSKEL